MPQKIHSAKFSIPQSFHLAATASAFLVVLNSEGQLLKACRQLQYVRERVDGGDIIIILIVVVIIM